MHWGVGESGVVQSQHTVSMVLGKLGKSFVGAISNKLPRHEPKLKQQWTMGASEIL